jgi:hypothetical protein
MTFTDGKVRSFDEKCQLIPEKKEDKLNGVLNEQLYLSANK